MTGGPGGAVRRGGRSAGARRWLGCARGRGLGRGEVGRGVRLVGPSAEKELGCGMGRCGAWAKLGRVALGIAGLTGFGFLSTSISISLFYS